MRPFPTAFRLVEKINDEASSSDSGSARDVLSYTYLDNAVLPSAKKDDSPQYVEAAATQTQG